MVAVEGFVAVVAVEGFVAVVTVGLVVVPLS